MTTDAALEWLHGRIVESDLFSHFFVLRDELGLSGDETAATVYALATTFMLGNCLKLATVLGELNGREHVVTVSRPDGSLLHALFACSPQSEGEPLKGSAIDVLGRINLRDAVEGLERHFGPVVVSIGDMDMSEHLDDAERGDIRYLAGAMPWTRRFARVEGVADHDLPQIAMRYRGETSSLRV